MSIRVSCPGCSASFKVKDEYAGKRAKCPQCGGRITVPAAEPPPPPPASGPADTIRMPPGSFPTRPAKPKPADDKDAPPAGNS